MHSHSYDSFGNKVNQIDIYHGSEDKWIKETFDSTTGQYSGKSIEYDPTGLLNLESGINRDLNNDEYVGDKITEIITGNRMTSDGEFIAGLLSQLLEVIILMIQEQWVR